MQLVRVEREEGITPWRYHWKDEETETSISRDADDADEIDAESVRSSDDVESGTANSKEEEEDEIINGGTPFILRYNEKTEQYQYGIHNSKMVHGKNVRCNSQLATFIGEEILQNIPEWNEISGFSEHK